MEKHINPKKAISFIDTEVKFFCALKSYVINKKGQIMKTLYNGHLPKGLRNFTKINFGLGARQMDKALINASLE